MSCKAVNVCKALKGLKFITKASPLAQGMFMLCYVSDSMGVFRNSWSEIA